MKEVRQLWNSTWSVLCAGMLLLLVVGCDSSSSIEDFIGVKKTVAYDPSKPVTISDFTPHEGAQGQKLILFGDNFGNDTSLVRVSIGGKPAPLISVENKELYCFVPDKAFSGEIEVTVGDSARGTQTAKAENVFNYQRKMVVGTLCGYRNERDDQGWHDGPFETCSGFRGDGCLNFDPLNHNHLYCVYDGGVGIQLIDLKKRNVSTVISTTAFGTNRLRSIDFTLDGQYMVISTDRDNMGNRSPSVWIMKRNPQGVFDNSCDLQLLAAYKQCNGASIHPVNGELYFNSFERGQVFRLDMDAYFNTINHGGVWKPAYDDHKGIDDAIQELFTIQDTYWEFKIFSHPSGKYAYIVVVNQHYILRTDYNEQTKRFAPAYVVAGLDRSRGWNDGVGTTARMRKPYQGCFVKNPDYVKENRSDQYDFYFCDMENHAIRKLTPDGLLTTYAGRGEEGHAQDGSDSGKEDGELRKKARFQYPGGIAYDEQTNTFYILDGGNREIRTISMEK